MASKPKTDLFPYLPYADEEDNARFLKWKLENAQLLEKMSGFSRQRLFMECVELSFLSDDKQRRLAVVGAAGKDLLQRAIDISMQALATQSSESIATVAALGNLIQKQKSNLDQGRLKGSKSQQQSAADRRDAIERMNSDLLKNPTTARWSLRERADYICSKVRKNQKTRESYGVDSMIKMIQGKG